MKRIIDTSIICSFIIPFIILVAVQSVASQDSSTVKHEFNVSYTGNDDSLQSVDIYWNSKSENAEVLIFVHGGGWINGDKSKYRKMAASLAENKFTVILVNYRLSPTVKFPAHVEDVAAAIQWTYDSVGNYNGNNKKLYLMGHSAGGHLVSLIALDKKYLAKFELSPKEIAGVISISGVFEIKTQEGGATKKFLSMIFGEDEQVWYEATCQNHINEESIKMLPPFMISWSNDENELIVNENLNIIDKFKSEGIDFQTYVFESSRHSTFVTELIDTNSDIYRKLSVFTNHSN